MGNTNVDLWKVYFEYGSGTWVIIMWICGRFKSSVWDMGNTNVDLQGIGMSSLDLFQDRAGDGVLKCLNVIFCNKIGEIA